MADTKISALSAVSSVVGAQEFAVNDAGTSKKATATQISAYMQSLGVHPGNKGSLVTGAIAETFGRAQIINATSALTSGTMRVSLIWLPVCTVTSISFSSGTTALVQGATTNHLWAALFQADLTFLQQSTNDTSPVWAANTVKTFTLSSTQAITTPGLYYVGLMSAGTGAGYVPPSLQNTNNLLTVGAMAALPAVRGSSTTGLTTTAPAPAAAIAPAGQMHYAYVS